MAICGLQFSSASLHQSRPLLGRLRSNFIRSHWIQSVQELRRRAALHRWTIRRDAATRIAVKPEMIEIGVVAGTSVPWISERLVNLTAYITMRTIARARFGDCATQENVEGYQESVGCNGSRASCGDVPLFYAASSTALLSCLMAGFVGRGHALRAKINRGSATWVSSGCPDWLIEAS